MEEGKILDLHLAARALGDEIGEILEPFVADVDLVDIGGQADGFGRGRQGEPRRQQSGRKGCRDGLFHGDPR